MKPKYWVHVQPQRYAVFFKFQKMAMVLWRKQDMANHESSVALDMSAILNWRSCSSYKPICLSKATLPAENLKIKPKLNQGFTSAIVFNRGSSKLIMINWGNCKTCVFHHGAKRVVFLVHLKHQIDIRLLLVEFSPRPDRCDAPRNPSKWRIWRCQLEVQSLRICLPHELHSIKRQVHG